MNEEIVGGLRAALERGESLKRAMMTFFNAGYKKEEIEEAARFVTTNQTEINQQVPSSPISQAPVPSSAPSPKQIVSNYESKPNVPSQKNIPETNQPVSNYGEKKSNDKIIVIVLIATLVFLLGLLASIFLFKNEIINFFSSLFG
jgi:hypothetical protein